jgi:hypothetical protein
MDRTSILDDIEQDIRRADNKPAGDREDDANDVATRYEEKPIAYYESASGYYESASGQYYVQNARGEWIRFTESSLKRLMERTIYSNLTKEERPDSLIADHLVALQTRLDIALATPMAGYKAGVHHIAGERILVTKSARPVRPRKGEWQTLRSFLETLLPDQTQYLYGWLKSAFKTLREPPPFRPGQLFAIAGPSGCGKSLLQNIITELFGGRSAKPYAFMTGQTNFNSELFYAEHLMIEDQAASTNIADRLKFGANIKNMLVNETQTLYRKGRESLTATPFWRATLSVNDEPEALIVLPPINADLQDKIILTKATTAKYPFDSEDIKARRAWRERITHELSAFVSFLAGWRIPDGLKDQRYGICAYQHPELLEHLAELAPQADVLDLIDALKPWAPDEKWIDVTAVDLRERLLEKDKHGRVNQILRNARWTGVYLSRLAKDRSDRVEILGRATGKAKYRIHITKEEKKES